MFDMLLWFAVVMVLFAVGDVVAKLTKARISSVFATLMLFLVLFVTGVLPADIIEKAGLSAASSWSVPMLLFAMGSMINLRQFMDEWRTVVTCWFGMLAVIIGVSLTIPIIGKEMALSAIPVVNGALPATQIMTEAATKAGYPLAAALAAITFAVQKFVGTPFASSASLRYAQGLIGEYRKAKSSGTLDEFMAAAGKSENRNSEAKTASKRITLAEKFDGFYSSNVCILLAVVGGLLSVWLGELTHINYAHPGAGVGRDLHPAGCGAQEPPPESPSQRFYQHGGVRCHHSRPGQHLHIRPHRPDPPAGGCVRGVGTFHLCYDESPAGVEDSGG